MRSFLILISVLVAVAASAHRQHFAFTEVALNERGDLLEVTHRFHEHDVAEWLRQQNNVQVDLTELRWQAAFAVHVEEEFRISGSRLTTLGAELDGRWLFVFQEHDVNASPDSLFQTLTFSGEILMNMLADQIHRIDVRLGEIVGATELSTRLQNVSAIRASTAHP